MTGYNSYSDLELADLLKSGDREAYTEIYDRYIFVLLNHAYNKTRSREEAKDIVQEVFAVLWTKHESLHVNNLPGYLYASVRNIILNQIAHQKVQDKFLVSMAKFASVAPRRNSSLRIRMGNKADPVRHSIFPG